MTPDEFNAMCNRIVRESLPECMVLQTHKLSNLYDREAEFTIKVRLRDEVKPNVVVDK